MFSNVLIFFQGSMLIYGGQTENKSSDQALWLFNITAFQWNKPKVYMSAFNLLFRNMINN